MGHVWSKFEKANMRTLLFCEQVADLFSNTNLICKRKHNQFTKKVHKFWSLSWWQQHCSGNRCYIFVKNFLCSNELLKQFTTIWSWTSCRSSGITGVAGYVAGPVRCIAPVPGTVAVLDALHAVPVAVADAGPASSWDLHVATLASNPPTSLPLIASW